MKKKLDQFFHCLSKKKIQGKKSQAEFRFFSNIYHAYFQFFCSYYSENLYNYSEIEKNGNFIESYL